MYTRWVGKELHHILAHLERRKHQKITDQAARQSGNAHAGKSSPPSGGANRQQGECFQMRKQGRCSRGDYCPYSHDGFQREGQGKRTPSSIRKGKEKGKRKCKGKGKDKKGSSRPASSRSSPPLGGANDRQPSKKPTQQRGRSPFPDGKRGNVVGGVYVSNLTRDNSKGKSRSGENDRAPCAAHIKGYCRKGLECREWHVPECRFYLLGNCRANPCVFLHRDNNAMQNNSDQYNPTQSNAKQHTATTATQINAKQDKAMQSLTHTTQRNSTRSNAEQRTAPQGNTMQYKATQMNAKQHEAM